MFSKTKLVACPTCGKSAPWTPANAWRPFCSERCKLVDLGRWADESYRMPVAENKDAAAGEDSGDGR
jgi:endogenous inhibitor of DNA gyrase (YacG/DUF329 family)